MGAGLVRPRLRDCKMNYSLKFIYIGSDKNESRKYQIK